MTRTLDFASHTDYLLAFLPECVLAVVAMGIILVDVFARAGRASESGNWTGWLAVVGVLLAAAANAVLASLGTSSTSAMVALDGYRVAANYVVLLATLLGVLFAFDYLQREGLRRGEFYGLMLLASVGMMVLVGARDLILLFVGLELMSIAVYVLTGFDRENPRSSEAGLKYFLVGAFASAFLLYGIALLYGAVGTTNLARVGPAVVEGVYQGEGSLLLVAGIGLLLVGFGFKIAAVPFHMWTPDAYDGAPTPVTGYMATGVKAAAFVAMLRVVTVDLAPAAPVWQAVLWWLAMLTMIVPNLVALTQDSVKRMLAYSSVAHAGYLLVGVVAGSQLGRAAALFYLGVYTIMTLGAFALVYLVAGRGDARMRLADYRGLGWRRPLIGVAMVVFLLSLAGFPPTGGFVGKLYLLRAAVEADQLALAITLVLTSLVAYYYYLRVVWKMYFDEPAPDAPALDRPGRPFRFSAALCAVAILVAGILPGPVVRGLNRITAMPERAEAPVTAAASEAPTGPAEDETTP
ncbi:MAG: NADH-quinone oxidoreductase subunit N [Planctomycetota bacterium]|jgi:NADH-quinone oxidoreductase subunit N